MTMDEPDPKWYTDAHAKYLGDEIEKLKRDRDEWRTSSLNEQSLRHKAELALAVQRDASAAFLADVTRLERELAEARTFGEKAAAQYNELLAKSQVVTCAFCGQEYPRGTPRHGDGELAEHIKTCPRHPMRALEAELADLKLNIEESVAANADAMLARPGGGLIDHAGTVALSLARMQYVINKLRAGRAEGCDPAKGT